MCKDTILLAMLVSGEMMHSDTPAGLFYIDMIQKLMKGNIWSIYIIRRWREAEGKRKEGLYCH